MTSEKFLTAKMTGAVETLKSELTLAHQRNDHYESGMIELILGRIHIDLSLYKGSLLDTAMGYFMDSYQHLKDINSVNAAESYGLIGRVMLIDGDRDGAIKYLSQAHKELHKQHNVYELDNLKWLIIASKKHKLSYIRRFFVLRFLTFNNPI